MNSMHWHCTQSQQGSIKLNQDEKFSTRVRQGYHHEKTFKCIDARHTHRILSECMQLAEQSSVSMASWSQKESDDAVEACEPVHSLP